MPNDEYDWDGLDDGWDGRDFDPPRRGSPAFDCRVVEVLAIRARKATCCLMWSARVRAA
jgi:hypothetical protein